MQLCLEAINLGYCNTSETRSLDVFDFLPNTKVSFTVCLLEIKSEYFNIFFHNKEHQMSDVDMDQLKMQSL